MQKKSKLPKPKRLTQPQLKRKYEKVIKTFVIERDGGVCQVAGINHTCSGPLVADHWKSRIHAGLFFDLRNLTCICNNANRLKRFDAFLADAVTQVVRRREGEGMLDELNRLSRVPKKWTEDEILDLIEYYKRGKTYGV
jgi:hypothetical protein